MNLDQYYIPFADHCNSTDIATEGFFMDDKNPKTSISNTYGTNVVETVDYKGIKLDVIGTKWAEVFIESHSKTTKKFKEKGLSFLSKVTSELLTAEQYVKSNGPKFREAIATKNNEVLTNLAEGLRKCLPTLLDYNHAANRGNRQFDGEIVEMDDAFKKKLIDSLNKFQRIYRDITILLAHTYINEHASKSTLKKVFRHTLKNYHSNNYLEKELYAYCKDVHITVQEVLYS